MREELLVDASQIQVWSGPMDIFPASRLYVYPFRGAYWNSMRNTFSTDEVAAVFSVSRCSFSWRHEPEVYYTRMKVIPGGGTFPMTGSAAGETYGWRERWEEIFLLSVQAVQYLGDDGEDDGSAGPKLIR